MRQSKIEKLRPEPTLIDRAYDAILAAIRDGGLSPGIRLNQDELAATLKISRQPVGQALTILKSQGFVRDNGRRGLIVAPLEADFVKSIYQLREALDPLAARLAAERCTEEDAERGRKLIAEGRRADKAGSVEALIEADMRLHLWINEVAGNPLLTQTMELTWSHLHRAMGYILRQPASRAVVWDEHELMVDAITHGEAKLAEKLALQHTHGAAERVASSGLGQAEPAPLRRKAK
jgi:DNA-binding GntR family transcriptional regulator